MILVNNLFACIVLAVSISPCWSFVAISSQHHPLSRTSKCLTKCHSAASEEALSEADRLRAKVAKLRAQAAAAEQSMQQNMVQKKANKDQQTDAMIEKIFGGGTVVDHLREHRPSVDTLFRLLERLDERQAHAEGAVFVEAEAGAEKKFHSATAPPDPAEAAQIAGWIEEFLVAVTILDQECSSDTHSSHVEHFGGGQCAAQLTDRLHELQRERSEHYQKRVADLREASRLKDDDDHKFHGYHDMGTLN